MMGMTFARPLGFLLWSLVLLLVFLYWNLWRQRRRCRGLLCDERLLGLVWMDRLPAVFWLKVFCMAVAWLLLTLGWVGPLGNPHFLTGAAPAVELQGSAPNDIYIFVDASASMAVRDSRNGASRLEYAQELASLLVEELQGDNIALYAFTSEVHKLSPPTVDYLFVLLQLRDLKINYGDTAGTDLQEVLQVLDGVSSDGKTPQTAVIFSDGGDTVAEEETGSAAQQRRSKLDAAVAALRKKGWQIIAVGMGDTEKRLIPDITYEGRQVYSELEETLLRRLVEAPRRLLMANRYSPLELVAAVKQAVDEHGSAAKGDGSVRGAASRVQYDHFYQMPLLGALLFLLFYLFYPDVAWLHEE